MGDKTGIEWTQATWNPTVGCDQVSPGCARCYAKTLHDRRHKAFLAGKAMPLQYAQPFEVLQLLDNRLDAPLRKPKPTTYFVDSVSDLFHEDVPDAFIDRVFAVMAVARQHTFQVLTKRTVRMRDYMVSRSKSAQFWKDAARTVGYALEWEGISLVQFPLRNVWLGTSVENQRFADERIPLLLQTPAAVRFISAEPLLGPTDVSNWLGRRQCGACGQLPCDCSTGFSRGLDWVIVGCESGKAPRNHEAYHEQAAEILRQCARAGVAAFHKQMPIKGRVSGTTEEFPPHLQIRQFPEARS